MELYFEDSASKIEKLAARLSEPLVDFNEMDQIVHQFKGSSASFGARAMAAVCVQLRDACHQQNQVRDLTGHILVNISAEDGLRLGGWGSCGSWPRRSEGSCICKPLLDSLSVVGSFLTKL